MQHYLEMTRPISPHLLKRDARRAYGFGLTCYRPDIVAPSYRLSHCTNAISLTLFAPYHLSHCTNATDLTLLLPPIT